MKIIGILIIVFLYFTLMAGDACYYAGKKLVCMDRIPVLMSQIQDGTVKWPSVAFKGGPVLKLTGELGINFAAGVTESKRRELFAQYGLTPVESATNMPNYVKVTLQPGSDPFAASRALVERGFAKWAQPVWLEKVSPLSTTPDDPYYGEAWHHAMIHSPEAWDKTTGDPRVVLGIVDCGTDTQHPDLFTNMLVGASFAAGENYVDPDPSGTNLNGYSRAHGTCVAGVAAATGNNGIGVTGVCWNCGILPVKYFGNEMIIPNDRKLATLKWTVDNGAWVINNSWLINQDKDGDDVCKLNIPYDNYFGEAVAYGKTNGRGGRGTIMVFGAGNSACNTLWNDNFTNEDILVVAAIRSTGDITDYSNYGERLDISAPAGLDMVDKKGLVTTDWTVAGMGYNPHYTKDFTDQSYTRFFSGTSGAAPVVTGAIGLLLSVAPYLTLTEVINCVKISATPGTGDCLYGSSEMCYGAGIVNAQAMVDNALNGACGGTPECKEGDGGGGLCGDRKVCWKGICVNGIEKSDDDVIPDEDAEVADDQPDTSEQTDDDIVPDKSVQPDTDTAAKPDTSINTDDDKDPGSDIEDTIETGDGKAGSAGCGCSII